MFNLYFSIDHETNNLSPLVTYRGAAQVAPIYTIPETDPWNLAYQSVGVNSRIYYDDDEHHWMLASTNDINNLKILVQNSKKKQKTDHNKKFSEDDIIDEEIKIKTSSESQTENTEHKTDEAGADDDHVMYLRPQTILSNSVECLSQRSRRSSVFSTKHETI